MSNDFFDSADYTEVEPGTLARAAQVNDIATAIVGGFDKLPAEAALKQDRTTYATAVAGTADAITLTLPSTLASYTAGLRISFKAASTNTGAATVNVDAVGAKSIKRPNGDALVAGDLVAGAMVDIRYDGTNFQVVGYTAADIAAAAASATAAAASAAAAATSASSAASSASAAATSASGAATSATNAATSETNAATSETNAATSETNAASSASSASTSASTATTQASNAATSASSASTSATNAASSATSASSSATSASSSATSASSSATTATTQASNASTSATNAAASADAAAQSALDAAGAVGGLKVSANDSTPSNLEAKLLPGDGMSATTQNDGGNETRTFAYTGHGENIRAALGLI